MDFIFSIDQNGLYTGILKINSKGVIQKLKKLYKDLHILVKYI